MGYSVDFIKLIAKKSGLKIEFINGYIWPQIMNMFQNKDIDIVQSLYKTPQREKLGKFTKPIYSFKNYFISKKDVQGIKSIKELNFKKVAVVEGWVLEKFLKKDYPDIKLVPFKDVSSTFLALSNNEVDALIDTKESFTYLSKQLYIKNLKVDKWFKEFDANNSHSIYMLLQKDKPLLLSIINKTMDSITSKELQQLHNKWFSLKDESTKTKMVDPALMEALLSKNHKTIIKYRFKNKNYFAAYKSIDNDLYLGFKIEAKSLLQPHRDNIQYSLGIALLLLLISIPVIVIATK